MIYISALPDDLFGLSTFNLTLKFKQVLLLLKTWVDYSTMICCNTLVVRGGLPDAFPERCVAFRVVHIGSNFLCTYNNRILECLVLILYDICLITAINLRHGYAGAVALLRSRAL